MKQICTCIGFLFLYILPSTAQTGTGSVSLTAIGTAATEDFNTLSNTAGSTTNTALPTGWYLTETGGGARDNEQYAVETGASTTGDTYSYGAAASTDRALGSLRSGTLIPSYGASFTNNTGVPVTSVDISFTGEQWRIGNVARTTGPDQLNMEYSTDATSLTTGTWTAAGINFSSPVTTGGAATALDGNAAPNQTAISGTITGLAIPNGATLWIRWVDVDAQGADDGLAVDNFSITPQTGVVAVTGVNLTAVKNNTGTTLSWTTEQEINSSYFAVQRSSDGNNWQNIAQVPAAGNSSIKLHYIYTDAHPLRGVNVYRLQMVSSNHEISYSESRRLNFGSDALYSVYPNPAKNIVWVTGNGTGVSTDVQVMNAAGIPVIQKQMMLSDQGVALNVENLKPGVYYMRISVAGDRPAMVSFIKQ